MNVYKDKIGTYDKYKFGTELEFTNINIGYLYKVIKDQFKVKFSLNHKMSNFDFNNNWCLDMDPTVTDLIKTNSGINYVGGELSSRIFNDDSSTWDEIKRVCKLLKKNCCEINSHCSSHVHVDMSGFYNNKLFYEVFSKLIAIYENDFRIFYMGDKYLEREDLNIYAKPMKNDILKIVNSIDFDDIDYKDKLFDTNELLFNIDKGVYISIEDREMEIRYPNGTLNENIIQNNINFTLKLIDSILNEGFDRSKLTYLVNFYNKKMSNYDLLYKYNYKGFEEIVNIISTDNLDKENFMCQYEKVLSTK